MSIWIQPTYATVWEVVSRDEKFAKVRLSTSRKNLQGEFINSNWFASFIGGALKKLNELNVGEKTRVLLQKGYVSIDSFQKDGEWRNYTNLSVFDFDLAENKDGTQQNTENPTMKSTSAPPPPEPEEDKEDYPF